MNHIFPPHVMLHTVTVGQVVHELWVDPSETFGHALARLQIPTEKAISVEVSGPLSYEPDWTPATR